MLDTSMVAIRIETLARSQNIRVVKMLEDCGINGQALQIMKGGRKSTPTLKTLIPIADYLGCSLDYLLGRQDVKPTTSIGNGSISVSGDNNNVSYNLTVEEQSIIDIIRKFDLSKKQQFLSNLVELDKK